MPCGMFRQHHTNDTMPVRFNTTLNPDHLRPTSAFSLETSHEWWQTAVSKCLSKEMSNSLNSASRVQNNHRQNRTLNPIMQFVQTIRYQPRYKNNQQNKSAVDPMCGASDHIEHSSSKYNFWRGRPHSNKLDTSDVYTHEGHRPSIWHRTGFIPE